jgi:(1->4)-alpha-D-glucan 1-alpha-D-glucosylmutase
VDHEAGVMAFVRAVLERRDFLDAFEPFAERVAAAGERSSLAQLLLKLTVPGVPDIYQGDELLSLSLVDPDNRRPVDWRRRRELLEVVRGGAAPTEETRKLWLIVRTLELRARRPEAFAGGYEPVDAGPDAIAFVRGGDVFVAAAIRGEPPSPPEGWRDVLGADDLGVALYERP